MRDSILILLLTSALSLGAQASYLSAQTSGTTAGASASGQVNGSGNVTGQVKGAGSASGQTGGVASASSGVTVGATLNEKSDASAVVGTLNSPDVYASIDFSTLVVKHVRIVKLSKLNGYTTASFKLDATTKNNMASLDEKLAANAALSAALKREGYRASDVVAISGSESGDITVFVAK